MVLNIQKLFKNIEKRNEADLKLAKDIFKDTKYLKKVRDYFNFQIPLTDLLNPKDVQKFLIKGEIITINQETMNKKMIHNETNLFCSYQINSLFYHNDFDFINIGSKVNVTRQEKNLEDYPELKKDLEKLNIRTSQLIDIEFFEEPLEERFYDATNTASKLKSDFSKNNKETNKKIKKEGIHLEQEKIHTQYIIGKFKEKTIYFPVYIGIGTNQPMGLSIKGTKGKNRFYRLNLLGANAFEQTFSYKTGSLVSKPDNVRNLVEIIPSIRTKKNGERTSWYAYLDDKTMKFRIYKYEFKNEVTNLIEEIRPEFKIKQINRIQKIKKLKNFQNSDLIPLIDVHKQNYDLYFESAYHPYKLLSELGSTAIEHLINQSKGILPRKELSNSLARGIEGNFTYLAEDFEMLHYGYGKLRAASLIMGAMITTGKLEKIILNKK